jgi:hypothetical protein
MTIFSKPLAEFRRYWTFDSTKGFATRSCIFHIPSSRYSNQYWWTQWREPFAKIRNWTGRFQVFLKPL